MSEEQEPGSEVAHSGGSARGLIIIALVIIGGIWLFSALRNSAQRQIGDTLNSTSCSLSSYRSQASLLMDELNDITNETDISSASSRAAAQTAVTSLLSDINRLECKDAYPLKHETLEFAARHFRDAMAAMDDGDAVAAAEALDAATLNASQFNNWSVDVGN